VEYPVQLGQATDHLQPVAELLERINRMPIEVNMNPLFSWLLPGKIVQCSAFCCQSSCREQQSANSGSSRAILTITTPTFECRGSGAHFNNTVFAPAAKTLEKVCEWIDTVSECTKKHGDIMKVLMKSALLTPKTTLVRELLLRGLVEICCYSFRPLANERNVSAGLFTALSGKVQTVVHDISDAMSDDQIFRFLANFSSPFFEFCEQLTGAQKGQAWNSL
jgi:hypothetical protein